MLDERMDPQGSEPQNQFYANPKDVIGHLLLVWTREYRTDIPGKFQRQDNKPDDCLIVDVVDLDLRGPHGYPGFVYDRSMWRQGRLIQKLKSRAGYEYPVLVRLFRDGKPNDNTAPFDLQFQNHDNGAREMAEWWLRANPGWQGPAPRTPEPNSPVQTQTGRDSGYQPMAPSTSSQIHPNSGTIPAYPEFNSSSTPNQPMNNPGVPQQVWIGEETRRNPDSEILQRLQRQAGITPTSEPRSPAVPPAPPMPPPPGLFDPRQDPAHEEPPF